MLLAASNGSLPIAKVLTNWFTLWPEKSDLYKAITRGENRDMLLWFLDRKFCRGLDRSIKHYQ